MWSQSTFSLSYNVSGFQTPAVPRVGTTAAQAGDVTKAGVPEAGATKGSGAATRCYMTCSARDGKPDEPTIRYAPSRFRHVCLLADIVALAR